MEFFCFLLFAIAMFATKAAGKAAKSSGAARSLWKAKKRNIIERLREQEERIEMTRSEVKEQVRSWEPPPAPREVLREAEETLETWGHEAQQTLEGLPMEVEGKMSSILEELPNLEEGEAVAGAVAGAAAGALVGARGAADVEPDPEPEAPAPAEEPASPTEEPEKVAVEEEFFDPRAGAGSSAIESEGLREPTAGEGEGALAECDDPATIVHDLFESGRPGFEISQEFEENYVGRVVEWAGTVDRKEPVRGVSTLREEPGVRVITEVILEGATRRVRVDIAVDQAVADRLERGGRVTYRGVLSACDPYLYAFHVRDARIV